jgi:anthranilate 1,2-dioxygenase large subunit
VQGTDQEDARTAHAGVGTYREGFQLQYPELLAYRDEFGDGCGLSIMSVFPNAVFHQIGNSLATRQIRPKGPNEFELFWTYYGYEDDSQEMIEHRLDQANLAGPAGLVSMEDGEAIELVHRSIASHSEQHSFVAMGADDPIETSEILVSEIPIRGFWTQYTSTMGIRTGAEA